MLRSIKRPSLLLAVLVLLPDAWAEAEKPAPLRVAHEGKYGFIDREGKLVVPLAYDDAHYFEEGLAAVNKGGKIITEKTESGTSRHFGGGSWGFIDSSGKEVLQLAYAEAEDFHEGLAAVKDPVARGTQFTHQGDRHIETGGRWRFIDKSGKTVIQPLYEKVRNFKDGHAVVMREGKWGVVNAEGKEIIPCQYAFVFAAGENRVWANIDGTWDEERERISGGRYRLLNLDGVEIVDKDFQDAQVFGEGMAPVRLNGRWGFIRADGKIAIQPGFEYAAPFSEGLARIGEDLKFGFIDRNRKVVVKPVYPRALDFHDGLAAVNKDAKLLHAHMTDGSFGMFADGGLWGFIDKTGKTIVEPKYTWAWSFSEGLAQVELGKKAGFVDKSGKMVIEPQFDHVGGFKNGLAPVWFGEWRSATQTWIDRMGHCLWNPGE